MRCFVGIPLPAETRTALVSACDAVRDNDAGWRVEKWVAAENLHLTVVFLGDIPEKAVPDLVAAISFACEGTTSFDLLFAGLRAVPNTRRASMLWATYADVEGHCEQLAHAIEQTSEPFGVAPEKRAFRAHATLVRARRPHGLSRRALDALNACAGKIPDSMSVRTATLFSSTLTPLGPRYSSVHEWEFPHR